uniref:Uncharacterized protein n=1 Tax=Anguilla anguilla TaxID=7936 RepID=A0A0E9XUF2_ANGAN
MAGSPPHRTQWWLCRL